MDAKDKVCAITGANGFVGRQLKHWLQSKGWRVVDWSRQPAQGVSFRLGERVAPKLLEGTRALVHCAYDFEPRAWDDIRKINVIGSDKLFQAAHQAGVESIVFISSLSAFAGCRSLYGKAKLEIEHLAQSAGAKVIRPGLIYGDQAGGMFGRLARQVRSSKVVPMISGGMQTQYLLHVDDLGELVLACLGERVPVTEPIAAAHQRPWLLKEILDEIARVLGKSVSFVPVPWRLVWAGLKTLEWAGVRANFRSDSLISMVYQNPNPSFELARSLGVTCRPFQVTAAMVATE